ncbi:MAG: hypothetical protein ACO1SX_01815 [Actinomycetota bacterium]
MARRSADRRSDERLPSQAPGAPTEHSKAWMAMAAAGAAATVAERAALHAQGICPVYQQDGVVVEELSDGRTRPLDRSLAVVD